MNDEYFAGYFALVILLGAFVVSPSVYAEISISAELLTPKLIVDATVINSQATTEKVRAIVNWTHEHLDWTDTDYVERTVDEILRRGGGNCYEQTSIVVAALEVAGIKTRQTREINIQPPSEERQRDAEERISAVGNSASVFGFRHNDHVWIEYWNGETEEWTPADPTLNLVGYNEWLRARMGYEGRPIHDIIPSRDMLVPIAVFAVNNDGVVALEDRSHRYLIDGFAVYNPSVVGQAEWVLWVKDIEKFSSHAHDAFAGEYNLHQDLVLIEELANIYVALDPSRR